MPAIKVHMLKEAGTGQSIFHSSELESSERLQNISERNMKIEHFL
jgi:hypothetical protein